MEELKSLTMHDLIEQNERLEKTVAGMANVLDDLIATFDKELGELWEAHDREKTQVWTYILNRR